MSLRSSFLRTSFSLLLICSLSALALADTIRLKDGSIIKGRIVSFSGGKFVISIGDGARLRQMTYSAAEIDSIVFDPPADKPPVAAYERPIGEAKIINTSSTIPETTSKTPPKIIVTDNIPRTNGSVTIGSPRPTNSGNAQRPVPYVSPTTTGNSGTNVSSAPAKVQPIAWNIKVTAAATSNGWTNSGWVLKKGQRIRITGDGQISLGNGKTTTASGLGELEDPLKLLKNVPTGALLAVIGDDNNDFIYVGAEREFTATRDGALFLGINEGNLDDNSGAFNVKVEILPDKSN